MKPAAPYIPIRPTPARGRNALVYYGSVDLNANGRSAARRAV